MRENGEARTFDFYVLFFFTLSFVGWLWEGAIYLVTQHEFVNRGVCKGPYLPIYGVGGLLLWFLLHKLSRKPVQTFFLSALVCSVLEYFTGFFLEWKWGRRWWDYSGYFMNLHGHVCLLSALAFGLAGMALNCILMPWYMKLYHKVSRRWRIALSLLLLGVLVADATYCAVQPHTGEHISTLAPNDGIFMQERCRFGEKTYRERVESARPICFLPVLSPTQRSALRQRPQRWDSPFPRCCPPCPRWRG